MKIYILIPILLLPLTLDVFGQQIHVDEGEDDGILITNPGADGIQIDSAGVFGIRIADPKSHGLFIDKAGSDGIFLNFPTDDGLHIFQAGDNGVEILAPSDDGAFIANSGAYGIHIKDAGTDGLKIDNPSGRGIDIQDAGATAVRISKPVGSGIDIRGAGVNGVYIRASTTNGIAIDSAGSDALRVTYPASEGLHIDHPGTNGIHVIGASQDGLKIEGAGGDGVDINGASGHGIRLNNVVADGIHMIGLGDDGLVIEDAMDDGIVVLNSEDDGIHVNGAGEHAGIFINSPSSSEEAVYIGHGNDDKADVHFGGHARLQGNGDFRVRLDKNDNSFNGFYVERSANEGGAWVLAVWESGDAQLVGNLTKGGGSFKIDHPLDPENKYLYHSFVESPDMMNVYNGNVTLNANGEAIVEMEDWFEALNRKFRYQLTAVGSASPNLFIAEKMNGNHFRIGGGAPGSEVSWQVTGVRQDPFANENRIPTEVVKEDHNRGKYLHHKEWAKAKGVASLKSVVYPTKTKEIDDKHLFDIENEDNAKVNINIPLDNVKLEKTQSEKSLPEINDRVRPNKNK